MSLLSDLFALFAALFLVVLLFCLFVPIVLFVYIIWGILALMYGLGDLTWNRNR